MPGAETRRPNEPVENEDLVTFPASVGSGATGTISVSRSAYGHANSLGFEVFGQTGAATFDLDRPAEENLRSAAAAAGV